MSVDQRQKPMDFNVSAELVPSAHIPPFAHKVAEGEISGPTGMGDGFDDVPEFLEVPEAGSLPFLGEICLDLDRTFPETLHLKNLQRQAVFPIS
jgi:hypothetical protein